MATSTMDRAVNSKSFEMRSTTVDRILVIEHDRTLQRILRRILSSEGYEVDVVESGMDGLDMLHRARHSAVVLDLQYPEASWFELCEKIAHLLSGLPLVVLTSSPDPAHKARLVEMGTDHCVTMPFSSVELLERLRGLLRRSSCADSEGWRTLYPRGLRDARCESWSMQ
jgi:DNA-binding response OmpR family regulator